jgi:mRNA-degrading endonuclease RelE of RelBE toxin-antitoxin system
MKIVWHDNVENDLKSLRRYPAPRTSLEAWQRLFCLKGIKEMPAIDLFPGFGDVKIYKGRVVPLQENVGKSKGYRVIFQINDQDDCCLILIFSRHGIYKTEKELMDKIKQRLRLVKNLQE